MDYSKIKLTHKELRLLRKSQKSAIPSAGTERLERYHLVSPVRREAPGYKPVPTGFVKISESGQDYLIYHKSEVKRIYTVPVVVSLATHLIIELAQRLWPTAEQWLLSLLQSLE